MALYMDRHYFGNSATWDEIKQAHAKDLALQDEFGVKMLTYWYDEERHMGFCLGESHHKGAIVDLHKRAHGAIPNEVIEVQPALVQAFLGEMPEVNGPPETVANPSPGTRTIMFTDLVDFTSLTSRLGDAAAMELLRVHDSIVRSAIATHGGRVVKHTGDGMMASFDLPGAAVLASARVLSGMRAYCDEHPDRAMQVRVGLACGDPIEEGGDLFGTAVQLAARLCDLAGPDGVLAAESVYEASGTHRDLLVSRGAVRPKGFAEPVLVFGLAGD